MPSCPCDNKNSPVGSTTKTATYLAVLNAWWPRSAPLPLAMPWLGMRVTRAAAERAITTYGALLPALPVSGAAAGTDPRNIEVLTDFAFRMISTEQASRVIMSGDGSCCDPGTDSKVGPCTTCPEFVVSACGGSSNTVGYGVNGDLCVGECADGFHPAAYVDEDGCIIDY